QPWRSFTAVINKCLSEKSTRYDSLQLSRAQILWGMYNKKNVNFAYLMWEDFIYQVEYKDATKSNEMYYPRFTKVIINYFMTKDPLIPRRNKFGVMLLVELTNEDIRNSKAYKEYYAVASGAAPPKTKSSVRKTKIKQPAKSSKAKSLTVPSEVAMNEDEQMKLATKRSLQQTHISQASGSGLSEGTGIIPRVPDVPTDEFDEEISWNLSDEDDDDEVDERTNDDCSLVFTTFSNPPFEDNDDLDSSDDESLPDEDVPAEEFKIFSNPLFDDKIYSDEINSQVESKSDESTSNHDIVKSDYLDEFYGPFIHIHILEEERIRREHADYINRMEMLFTINPRPYPSMNANTNVESFSSLPIPIQESDPRQEEIDIVAITNDVLPLNDDNDDSYEDVDAVGDLRIDNSIQYSEHEYSESEESDFDIPPVPLPPSEPPDKEFDVEINFGVEILVVRNTIVKIECIDAEVKFDVFNDDDDLSYFMFVIFDKVFSLLSAESEDTIFDPGISD
nr:hypothetical protein [Tanacetum cinerariifolium]